MENFASGSLHSVSDLLEVSLKQEGVFLFLIFC